MKKVHGTSALAMSRVENLTQALSLRANLGFSIAQLSMTNIGSIRNPSIRQVNSVGPQRLYIISIFNLGKLQLSVYFMAVVDLNQGSVL
jgi:hypothetical protein